MFAAIVLFVIVAIVVGAGAIGYTLYKALPSGAVQKLLAPPADTLGERSLRELRAGDIVTRRGTDFVCEGAIAYEELGHRWVAGLLVDTNDAHWLVAGLDRSGDATVRLLHVEPNLKLTEYPAERIALGDQVFALDKRGIATCTLTGNVRFLAKSANPMRGSAERCRWWLYSSAAGETLLIEQWGADYRALRGAKIDIAEFAIIHGS